MLTKEGKKVAKKLINRQNYKSLLENVRTLEVEIAFIKERLEQNGYEGMNNLGYLSHNAELMIGTCYAMLGVLYPYRKRYH